MDETIWHLVRDERLSLASTLEQLPEQAWTSPSLCSEWTVHDVVAHLAMIPAGEPRPRTMVQALVRARGRLWTAGRDVAVAYARHSPQDLLASLRDLADARTKPVFVVSKNILLDLVVHGQDIAVPLGVARPVPDAAAEVVLARVWTMGWPFHARRRLRGVHLMCEGSGGSGVVWQAGSGPSVRGSAGDLALLMTGRSRAALPRLRGAGVDTLSARLQPSDGTRRGDRQG